MARLGAAPHISFADRLTQLDFVSLVRFVKHHRSKSNRKAARRLRLLPVLACGEQDKQGKTPLNADKQAAWFPIMICRLSDCSAILVARLGAAPHIKRQRSKSNRKAWFPIMICHLSDCSAILVARLGAKKEGLRPHFNYLSFYLF